MSGIRSLTRRPVLVGVPAGASAPISVDDGSVVAANKNKITFQPEGAGVTTIHTVMDDGGVPQQRIEKTVTFALAGAAIHAGAVGIVNPEAVDVIITGINVRLSTHATAASGAIDVGTTTSSITTASDNLADGLLVGSGVTVPVAYGTGNQQGANGKVVQNWVAGKWVTVSDDGTADVTGLVGILYITYILA